LVKNTFSIKDLENLSGIKAHTIRIWEKRYQLLSPNRSVTNIRSYNLHSLQKLLNVSYLKNSGMRISVIASLNECEIEHQVRDLAQSEQKGNHNLQELKLAMVNFDESLFNKVYHRELESKNLTSVYFELIVPFLKEMGHLWQSNTINIAHEHFISNLIKQKLLIQTELIKSNNESLDDRTFVLFLPENEMHDLGLLFLNYKLQETGRRTIFLGASMSLESLSFFQRNGQEPIFITFTTVEPNAKKLPGFLERFNSQLNKAPLILLGSQFQELNKHSLTSNQKAFYNIESVMNHIESQTSA